MKKIQTKSTDDGFKVYDYQTQHLIREEIIDRKRNTRISMVYYPHNGQLERKTYSYKDNEYQEWFYKNGNPKYRWSYIDGKEEGLQEGFFDNGQLEYSEKYKNNKRDGLWEYFDEEGNLTETKEYKDGELIE
tara:strand:- start:372 stop:767 length:396 start_codon:yes stop_codon:yes gene_type:complete